jgi:putative ABC transport system substrate-binding protein
VAGKRYGLGGALDIARCAFIAAPGVKRAAIMFNPDTASGGGSYFLPAFDAAARSLKVAPIAASVRSDAEIETIITSLGREPGGGRRPRRA